jgi:hypothetical protein
MDGSRFFKVDSDLVLISDIPDSIDNHKSAIRLYEPNVKFPSTTFNEHMIKCLNKIKIDLFDPLTFKYWKHVIIAGGYVLDLLYDIKKSSDIDFYIYNVKEQLMIDEIANYIIRLLNGKMIHETKGVMTIKTKNGKSVQIINAGNRQNIADVLNKFDIDICKIAFDGYQIVLHASAANEVKNRMINFNNSSLKCQTPERMAKYVHKKQFGFLVNQQTIDNINPLYLFRESHGFDKFIQLSKLLQDYTLQNIYKMLVIRTNFDSNNLNAMIKYAKEDKLSSYSNDSDSPQEDSALTGKALTSYIKEREFYEADSYNQFGQPKLFEAIRKGKYEPEDLYGQQIVDSCGFNTTCMMVLFEADEQKVIDFLKEIHKVGSKNMNRYKINYLVMASLLNRQNIVRYLMNSSNYREVMKIAVKEDNLELYKLAYCTHSSKDRYLFSKEELLKYSAYSIYGELYGTDDIKQNIGKSENEDPMKYLEHVNVSDFIVQFSKMTEYEKTKVRNFLITNSVKNIKCIDELDICDMSCVEKELYYIYFYKINRSTKQHYNKLLKNITTKSEYAAAIEILYEIPTKYHSIEYRANLIEINSKCKIPNDYKFDDQLINELIIHTDNPEMVMHTTYKRYLMDMLKEHKNDIQENLKQYAEEHLRKTTDPTLYSGILSNTKDHDLAYSESILNAEYVRKENALGCTPCDIIIYQTLRDYANNYGITDKEHKHLDVHYSAKNLANRRKSVRMINRSLPILPYTDSPKKEDILKLLPELDIVVNNRQDESHNDCPDSDGSIDYDEYKNEYYAKGKKSKKCDSDEEDVKKSFKKYDSEEDEEDNLKKKKSCRKEFKQEDEDDIRKFKKMSKKK